MSESLEQKQLFLRTEIIEKGYSAEEFSNYMGNLRGEAGLDLDTWLFSELQQVVNQFKIQYNQQQSKEQLYENKNEYQGQDNIQDQKNYNIQEENIDNSIKESTLPEKVESRQENISEPSFPNEPFEEYQKIIKTKKLDNNEITEQNNLHVSIKKPVKVNPGIFSSSYYQYTVETNPVGFKVIRKLSDFTFLYETLPIFNNLVYNPILPHFELGLKDDSSKKILYLQNYVNTLVENKYFRTLPIVYEFLTLPQENWNKIRHEIYTKMKLPSLSDIPTLEGELHIKINNLDDNKGLKIKDEINNKSEAFDNLNTVMDELLEIIEKLSLCYKSLTKTLLDLKTTHKANKTLHEFFNRLSSLTKIWSQNYIQQKDFLRDEFKYFLKFMNKENNSYLKKYDDFKIARDDYKSKYEKVKKMSVKQKKDLDCFYKLRIDYGLQLLIVNKEYDRLIERQANRCMKQFGKFNNNKDIILQNFNNCIKLFNINENIKNNNEELTLSQNQPVE